MLDRELTIQRRKIDLFLRRSQYVIVLASQIAWTSIEAAAVFLWQWVRWLAKERRTPQ